MIERNNYKFFKEMLNFGIFFCTKKCMVSVLSICSYFIIIYLTTSISIQIGVAGNEFIRYENRDTRIVL